MDDEKKISIVVPVYNMEKHLRCCLDSLINQTYSSVEIIVVDDGSQDESPIICDEYANKYENVKVIHKTNGGVSSARNEGINIAKGHYISFVDSDDYIHPMMIEKLLNEMTETHSDISVCQFKYVNEECNSYVESDFNGRIGTYSGEEALNNLMSSNSKINSGIVCDKLFDIHLFDELRFTEGQRFEDELIIHHIFGRAQKVTYIRDEYYYYRMRTDRFTSKYSLKNMDMLLAHEDRLKYYRENYPKLLKKEVEWYLNILDYNYFKLLKYFPRERNLRKNIVKMTIKVLDEANHGGYISNDAYKKYMLFVRNPMVYKLRTKGIGLIYSCLSHKTKY